MWRWLRELWTWLGSMGGAKRVDFETFTGEWEGLSSKISAEKERVAQSLTLALEAAQMGQWDLDLVHDRTHRSLRHDQIFGYSALQPEWGWRIFIEHVVPADRDAVTEQFRNATQNGGTFHIECRIVWADRSTHWIAAAGRAYLNDQGVPVRLTGVVMDITEQKRMEERFRAMVESAPNAWVMIDQTGKIVLVNVRAEALFGYARDELLGRPIEMLLPERFRAGHADMRNGYLANPLLRRMGVGRDLYALREDGTEVPVEIGLSPVKTSDGVFVLSAIVDITERKRAEQEIQRYASELERSNRELDQFAYSASHDLKAPLRAVDHLAEWITEDVGHLLPEAARRDLALMRQRIGRMQCLLDDLLAYSRIGRVPHKVARVDSAELVREVVKLLAPPAGFTIVTGTLPVLTTEQTPLEHVFLNLIGNAIKHHHRPDGKVQVSATDRGEFVEFIVRDDGPGIPPEFHARVFQMFQTLKPRDQVEGSGMGLALVKKIVESQGGTITLESTAGGGAAFRFSWPQGLQESA